MKDREDKRASFLYIAEKGRKGAARLRTGGICVLGIGKNVNESRIMMGVVPVPEYGTIPFPATNPVFGPLPAPVYGPGLVCIW